MEKLYGFSEIKEKRTFEKEVKGKQLIVKKLSGVSDIGPYLDLLNMIWAFDDPDKIPLHEAIVNVHTGGLFLGVDYNGVPVGLVYVMPSYNKRWGYHHHSNFMGFTEECRSLGIGMEAKRAHAVLALREGVDLVTWTFDPLKEPNADFNFRKLGCVCDTYIQDLYGTMESEFNPGLPTDRFMVKWELKNERVMRRLAGTVPTPDDIAEKFKNVEVISQILGERTFVHTQYLLKIPSEIFELVKINPKQAKLKLNEFSDIVSAFFKADYEVRQMIRAGIIGPSSYYLLQKK